MERSSTLQDDLAQVQAAGEAATRVPSPQPTLYVCGMNHERTSLSLRERFALNHEQCILTLERIRDEGLAEEAMVLSTCNRTEICVFGPPEENFDQRLRDFFLSLAGDEIDRERIPPLYDYDGLEAARHFFAVNAGLNSMILGETEIKSQIKDSFGLSKACEMAGPNLHRLIEWSNRCSKRIRTETDLNTGTLSFAKASVLRAEEVLGTIEGKACVVIGAGKVGRVAAQALAERNPSRLSIVNRTVERAQEVAQGLKAEAVAISEMFPIMREADLILGAAFAPNFLVTRQMFEHVRGEGSKDKKVCLIDAAVPRILDQEIGEIEGVTRLDISDLEEIIAENRAKRTAAAQRAWVLVEDEVEKYHVRVHTANLSPIIERLKDRFDAILAEIEEDADADLPESIREKVRSSRRKMKQRLLHEAIRHIKTLHLGGRKDS